MKGLIYEKAQGCQLGTLMYFEEGPPIYKKQQRKKRIPTKQGKTPWLPDYQILPQYYLYILTLMVKLDVEG